jgi:hypothetical protein
MALITATTKVGRPPEEVSLSTSGTSKERRRLRLPSRGARPGAGTRRE